MPSLADIASFSARLTAQAQATGQRRALVLAGEAAWCRAAAQVAAPDDALWISSHAPEGVRALAGRQVEQVLGREYGAVVFDAWSGFDADAFGAVSGTVRGGGLLLLLIPPLADWRAFPDPEHARVTVDPYPPRAVTGRFLRRLARVFATAPGVTVIAQGEALPSLPAAEPRTLPASPDDPVCRTRDQAEAVEAILRLQGGRARRPLVLYSDRGRGKSAALGIAAAELLRRGVERILVTAPRREAAAPIFEHAARRLPEARHADGGLVVEGGRLSYAAPDELERHGAPANLLLVDEAAAIPMPLLERLLDQYGRVVFATTVHGYEGTGRGFGLRFGQVLDRHTRGWKALELQIPIRWAAGDPVEQAVFSALLLDAEAWADEGSPEFRLPDCHIERLDRDRLADDESLLRELFGLLVSAHYRTSPSDLRQLLDGPNLSVYAARWRGHALATALVAREGGFDPATARAIFEGRRRPRGHLLPETLAAQVGLPSAPTATCARLVRIAVHPALQGRGLGSRLIDTVIADARADGLDYAGASFGATPQLLRFWQRNGFLPVRLGIRRGAASGLPSAAVLRPLSAAGEALLRSAREHLHSDFPQQLSDPLRDLDPALAAAVLQGERALTPALGAEDWQCVTAFAYASRTYEATLGPIWALACAGLADPTASSPLTAADRAVLIAKVLQRRSWAETAALLGFSGRAAVVHALRQAMRPLVLRYGDPQALADAQRLMALGEPSPQE